MGTATARHHALEQRTQLEANWLPSPKTRCESLWQVEPLYSKV